MEEKQDVERKEPPGAARGDRPLFATPLKKNSKRSDWFWRTGLGGNLVSQEVGVCKTSLEARFD